MSKIFYIGFGEMMESVHGKLVGNSLIRLIPITQLTSEVHKDTLEDADVLLVGPLTINPVQQIQRAYRQNSLISIVVLAFQEQFQRIKQTIHFSHNVGKNLTIIPYQFGKDISEVLESAIMRTKQRKSFVKLHDHSIFPKSAGREVTYQNLDIFLENAPIGAIVFDREKKVISANLKAKHFFGKKLDLRYRVTWADLFPGQDYSQRINSGSEQVHEIIKVNDQFLEVNMSPFLIEKDKPHYLLLVNDVTRTIDVENQLKSKIEELEFLNRELDEFVNVVSHDFKTPLTAISLLTELALKESSDEKKTHFLLQISRSSEKLKEQLRGLNKLVDVKKKRSEKAELVDFWRMFDIVLSEYKESLEEIGGKLISDFSQAPEIVYFEAHINSLLSNLITNAIKYRREDIPLTIEVTTKREKDYIVLTVKDNADSTHQCNFFF